MLKNFYLFGQTIFTEIFPPKNYHAFQYRLMYPTAVFCSKYIKMLLVIE
jgi:hypothetical protein